MGFGNIAVSYIKKKTVFFPTIGYWLLCKRTVVLLFLCNVLSVKIHCSMSSTVQAQRESYTAISRTALPLHIIEFFLLRIKKNVNHLNYQFNRLYT